MTETASADPHSADRPRTARNRVRAGGTEELHRADAERVIDALRSMRTGDLAVRLPSRSGLLGEIADAVNGLAAAHQRFHRDLAKYAKRVGEGRTEERLSTISDSTQLSASATVVNEMVEDLLRPGRDTRRVISAVLAGDLSARMQTAGGVQYRGEFKRKAQLVDAMVTQLAQLTDEVTRVAREVGTEGRLGGQAKVPGVAGTWKDLTDNVNFMARNLTDQVRDIAQVTTAVANGDLSQKITADVRGEVAELKDTINTMVDQLSSFADEVTRVAREVGTEGRLGGQAQVPGVSGTWKDLTDNVNFMARNLTDQVRDIAQVTTAVANGDLSQKISVEAKGEVAALAETINRMVDQLSSFADEVTRVAREVGTEGRLGGQAQVEGVSGTWRDLTQSVNQLAGNLTAQVRNIAQVTTAVADGDLSQKISVEAKGEVAALAQTINTMVDQLSGFADEVTRVATEVGTEGRLGGQAEVAGVAGTWKDLTDSVNFMAGNLTAQVRDIAQVTTAVARGDLTQKITVDVRGEVLELKNTINTMVDQLSGFADEVTRVATEVGTEGRLGGQAQVPGVGGTWKHLTESVNSMARNLTSQVRDIAQVTTAVADGDLSQKISVEAKGEVAALAETINRMVDQLSGFADEVTRVAREVGTDGRLGGQAEVPGVAGTWKDLTDSVNFMAGNLTAQVRDIARVTTAVARGDLTQTITVDVKGEVLELKNTINTMVDQLSSFADEVTRVAREVGTDGKLGGQAEVGGVAGTWKDLTQNVNLLAGNLTAQVRNIAQVTTAVAEGDLSQKISVEARGEVATLRDTINKMVDQLRSFAAEVSRVAREVGTEGRLGGQAQVEGVSGTWRDLTHNVNQLAGNLTAQVRNIAQVTTAVAKGDLTQTITVDARGEVAELKNTINTMVDQLSSFADEVTRVAREVGTEGRLGGQAQVPGVSGTWKDLTDNVNFMARNLTDQVRDIAQVTTAVANGDLSQKITVDVRGEVAELKATINTMVDQLSSFAAEVTRVAREVGTDGKLGGQARVEGVSGTWKDLTENVNQLAGNLTTQVRSIAEVSTAVTRGDLTRQINVDAAGEVAELKDNINQMIANLRETTTKNAEQDWLKSNLARTGGLLQGQRNLETVCQLIMSELTPLVGAQNGTMFLVERPPDEEEYLRFISGYGVSAQPGRAAHFALGETLVGQAALDRRTIHLDHAPPDYVRVVSGIGEASVGHVIILPVFFEDEVLAVIELGSFHPFSEVHVSFLDQFMESVGVVLNTIMVNGRTEELLEQSQLLTRELQQRSVELQQTNEELAEKARLLELQNRDIEVKNSEIEAAQVALQERAEQLALSSKYKSEFLANMSHELRTPLNSLLILARLLAEDPDGHLAPKQVEYARTIHAAGTDLLTLISDILDLSKVEAGKMELHPVLVPVRGVIGDLAQTFEPTAEQKGLAFEIVIRGDAPDELRTDEQRLQQVVRNLLSNALKFTERGEVRLIVGRPEVDVEFTNPYLVAARDDVIAFAVVDTGVGVPREKLDLIFESFQQADGTTSRRFGGTGLGLSISREITSLLGGELHVASEVGAGSTFTLYLPVDRDFGDDGAGSIAAAAAEERRAERAHIRDVRTKRATRTVLVVDPDDQRIHDIVTLIGDAHTSVVGARGVVEALEILADRNVDCAVVDVDAAEVVEQLEGDLAALPVIMVVRDTLTEEVTALLQRAGEVRPVRPVSSPRELYDATAVFVHRRPLYAVAGSQSRLTTMPAPNPALEGRRILLVDDDPRNLFAVSSVLEAQRMEVVFAENGMDGITLLRSDPTIELVLMDIMMPGMDGHATIKVIREDERFADLPIVALTAKAMVGDREKTLAAGASDYITKPVDIDDLLGVVGDWLTR